MGKRNRLSAVLVGCDLGDDLGGDVARRRETLGLFDHRSRNDRPVLQHILKVHEIAVVHMLGIVVHVVEMDDALVVRLYDVSGQKKTRSDVLGDLAGHVVALDGVDRRILVGVLLLHVLVVAFDERHDLLVGRVRLTQEILLVAVGDVLFRHLMRTHLHDLRLDDVLNLFDRHRPVARLADTGHFLGDKPDAPFRKRTFVVHRLRSFANRIFDLGDVKFLLFTAALDDFHLLHISKLRYIGDFYFLLCRYTHMIHYILRLHKG